ncbi:uncharacterized protein [Antedon mediterranea]|uniref:uncharacterized protein isoform X2 n=1 Tax=Antedon mediterranea TaxID=105859 RepID=UPI003AF8BC7D
MSFKRDGDDYSQLNVLKKRRVAELFAHHIPDDEAFLMSNGRYACTVCHYRPVFDTLDMLTIHRRGKKHQKCLEAHYKKKRDYMHLVEKKHHENYLKKEERNSNEQEEPSPLITKTNEKTRNLLLKAQPYNSCVKWGRPKDPDKSTIDDGQHKSHNGIFFTSTHSKLVKEPATTEQCTSNMSTQIEIDKARWKCHVTTNNTTTELQPLTKLVPYISKSKRKALSVHDTHVYEPVPITQGNKQDNHLNTHVYGPVPKTQGNKQNNHLNTHVYGPVPKTQGNKQNNHLNTHVYGPVPKTQGNKQNNHLNTHVYGPVPKTQGNKQDNQQIKIEVTPQIPVSTNSKDANSAFNIVHMSKGKEQSSQQAKMQNNQLEMHEQFKTDITNKKKEIKRILQLTSSGWKRDRGGKWVKNEDVEFDSDEEEPT